MLHFAMVSMFVKVLGNVPKPEVIYFIICLEREVLSCVIIVFSFSKI